MKMSDAIDTLVRLNKPMFSVYDMAKIMGKPTNYTSLVLSKNKKIERIERGKYALAGTDIYKIASNIVFPSYISLQSGLQYYGLIDQNIIKFSVISLKWHKQVTIRDKFKIEFLNIAKDRFFGYINKDGVYIASVEKLFLDCLYFGKLNFELLIESLGTAIQEKLIDVELLNKYALRMKSSVLINKLGFVLEKNGIKSDFLLKYRYKNYVKVQGFSTTGKDEKWRIIYDR